MRDSIIVGICKPSRHSRRSSNAQQGSVTGSTRHRQHPKRPPPPTGPASHCEHRHNAANIITPPHRPKPAQMGTQSGSTISITESSTSRGRNPPSVVTAHTSPRRIHNAIHRDHQPNRSHHRTGNGSTGRQRAQGQSQSLLNQSAPRPKSPTAHHDQHTTCPLSFIVRPQQQLPSSTNALRRALIWYTGHREVPRIAHRDCPTTSASLRMYTMLNAIKRKPFKK